MDVHPPHEPVHGWRDALTHIAIMTVGLFIALLLEAGVEALHHRELVKQARENIRHELEQNHTAAQQDIVYLRESGDKIKRGVVTLHSLQAHPDAKHQSIEFGVEFTDLNDAAWRTARDTGALGFMPLDEVQHLASTYAMQELVSDQERHLLTAQTEALSPLLVEEPDFPKMPAEQFVQMRQAAAKNFADVLILQQLLKELDQEYTAALKQQ